MRSSAVTTVGSPDEPYADFQKRTAQDAERVKAKIAGLDPHVPFCKHCGETVEAKDAGERCRVNNSSMASAWARKTANSEFCKLGNFARGGWPNEVEALACLLDRVWALGKSERPAST